MKLGTLSTVCAASLLMIIAGCGGGGSGSPPPPPPPTLLLSPATMPQVVQGQPYTFTFHATGGTGALSWSGVGALPDGMALSADGIFSGTPTVAGFNNFRVQVRDSGSPQQTAQADENFYAIGLLSLSGVSFPNANRGIGYQFSFFPVRGRPPFTFAITSGALPPGFSVSTYGNTAGQVSGTPTQAGTFSFTLQVTDAGEGALQQTASAALSLKVDAILKITTLELPSGILSRPYTGGLSAVNGVAPLHWSVPFVPAGLTFNSTTGVFSGTPTEAVSSSFAVSVTDSSTPPQDDTASVTWFLFGPLSFLQTDLGSVPIGTTGALFPIYFMGGEPPVTSSIVSGTLPVGLTLNSTANFFGGGAQQIGHYSIGVRLQDSASPPQTAQATLSFAITPVPPVIANTTLPGGVVGHAYHWGLAATNGQPPISWSLDSSSLPPGLTLDARGLISGTPTLAGTYSFGVRLDDSFAPPDTSVALLQITVHATALGRNDSIAKATPLTNGNYIATISPYSHPSSTGPDSDYYKVTANPGGTVSIAIVAARLIPLSELDPVIELLDGSGTRLSTCKDPAAAFLRPPLVPDPNPNDFNDACINDDDPNTGTTDSSLAFKVPGASGGAPVTFYLHVLDWRGDARPDFSYQVLISGAN